MISCTFVLYESKCSSLMHTIILPFHGWSCNRYGNTWICDSRQRLQKSTVTTDNNVRKNEELQSYVDMLHLFAVSVLDLHRRFSIDWAKYISLLPDFWSPVSLKLSLMHRILAAFHEHLTVSSGGVRITGRWNTWRRAFLCPGKLLPPIAIPTSTWRSTERASMPTAFVSMIWMACIDGRQCIEACPSRRNTLRGFEDRDTSWASRRWTCL